ncbi:MAG: EF-hand domain-containing protein [Marinosulfonomonas sp.]|nr:EF-hand domain-containing protein [Marinosulfonomonas sp.]
MLNKNWMTALTASAIAVALIVPAVSFAKGGGQGGGGQHERPSFGELDTDGDGNLTVAEFRARAMDSFAAHDLDGDGLLSVEEMTEAAAARSSGRSAMKIARMMEFRDLNGDGALSPEEMAGNKGEKIFGRMDADGDGVISAQEFEQAQNLSPRGGNKGGNGGGGGAQKGHGQHSDG